MPRRPDSELGLRLTLAAVAAVLLLVPFTVLVLLVATAWPPLLTLDADLAARLHAGTSANPTLAGALQLWTDVFGPGPLRVAVGAAAGWLWWRGARRVALWAVVTMVAGGLLGAGLKLLLGRDRPEFLDPVSHAAGYSFPSGHALTAALGAGVLLLIFLPFVRHAAAVRTQRLTRCALVAAALIVAVVTGLTRIALGVHWLSDVVAGWTLGAAVVAATTAAFATWRGQPARRPASRPAHRSAAQAVDGAFDEAAHPDE
ncbi:phosphatase PAP2 family protein [Dactylosporangium aurantiacum]|uniref:phosphatase PAP2 family protein n=1 Tax=Dactylosporangium aurantiacum TaxID=35754 RepID=UPI000693C199|nr:phosphatase PAP2 family protein [Dactylosporangium aurantiacum]MDG6101442.1 phosphatase PAP2 family protein [Dactylosporangium aurantiacum]